MDDLISRQEAIDNLERYRELFSWDDGERERAILSRVIKELQFMPSAQPEIIRCKDCLIHGVCRFEQGLGLDGYCSQGERRTDG